MTPATQDAAAVKTQEPQMTMTGAPNGNLEITVSRAELLRELTAAQSVVERKTTIPILSNFLFEAADDTLTITATDLDQSIRTSCPAKVKKPGAAPFLRASCSTTSSCCLRATSPSS
jgi:hypothetical protein